jgi:hypothetical protein
MVRMWNMEAAESENLKKLSLVECVKSAGFLVRVGGE